MSDDDKPIKKPQVSSLFETSLDIDGKDDELKTATKEEQPELVVQDDDNGGEAAAQAAGEEVEIDPLVGTVFAEKYEVESVLGKGGMSTVYKVIHRDLDNVLALKVLHKHLWTDPLSVERFRLEAKTIGKLSSPYLITFRDFGVTSDGQPYLVMDYLEGVSLGRKIYDEKGLAITECLDIFEKLCEGLGVAHKNGVTHRDIKPANVMFLSDDSESMVKLVDFGIAKLAAEESDQRMTLTQTGEVFGSPLYMSPEQCLGLTADHRSDIYSLGCLFYEAIVGMPPFIGSNVLETMNAHVDQQPEDIMKSRDSLPQEAQKLGFEVKDLNYVIMKCLQKLPTDRYQSLEELVEDLKKIRSKNSITKKQRLWIKRDPKKKIFAGVLGVMAAIMVSLIVLYFVNPQFQNSANTFGRQVNWQSNFSFGKLASTLRDFEAAEAHYRDSLDIANSMESPSEKHVKRLASLEALAGALQFQAKYPEQDKVVEEHKKELRQSLQELANVEDEDPGELIDVEPKTKEAALANALLFDKMGKQNARGGKTDAAVKYLEKSYELKKKWLKEGDESLIKSMDALASVYILQGKRHKAGHLWQEGFKQAEKYLSDDSSVKVSLYDNMGRIRQDHNQFKEAERCYKKAVELSKRHFGDSITTIKVMKDYAALLNQLKRQDEAEKVWSQVEAMESRVAK